MNDKYLLSLFLLKGPAKLHKDVNYINPLPLEVP